MPYCSGPYSTFTSLPAPEGSPPVEARKIDFALRRYVQDDASGFESMPPVAQRVILAVCFAGIRQEYKDPREELRIAQEIRTALSSMTSGNEPEIDQLSIVTLADRPGAVQRRISFRDLTTGKPATVIV